MVVVEPPLTNKGVIPPWSCSSAFAEFGGFGSSNGGHHKSGWTCRRHMCGVSSTSPNVGVGDDDEGGGRKSAASKVVELGKEVDFGGTERSKGLDTSGSGGRGFRGGGSGEPGQEAGTVAKQNKSRQKPQAKDRRPARPRQKKGHPFGKPLSLLAAEAAAAAAASASAGQGGPFFWPFDGGGCGGVDAEDELPDPELIEVEREGEGQDAADADDPRARVSAARPEVVHALSRGLAEGRSRLVADNLCSYATSSRTTESTLAQLERLLARRPHQVEWVMPLVRAHLTDETKPSAETHREHLSYVRDFNTKQVSHEDMAETLLHTFARHRWGPDMTREKLRTEHPERWEEAISLSEKLADRLPVCRHELLWRTLRKFLEAEQSGRRQRILAELSTVLRSSAHLVLPAIAKFWRLEITSRKLQEDVEAAKEKYRENRAVLARWLLFARRKSLDAIAKFNGPWSLEELQEQAEARDRERELEWEERRGRLHSGADDDDDDEVDEEDGFYSGDGVGVVGGGGEGEGRRNRRRPTLDTAAMNVISQALPPQVPPPKPAVPLGLFELHVVENPRALYLPPPRDIFGGDTPAGIGEAGSSEVPDYLAGDKDVKWERAGEAYAWPEEREADGEEGWWEGAGRKELSRARAKDYQDVEDVLLTGKRRQRRPDDEHQDLAKDPDAIAVKKQLLERSALVADLHPDQTRQVELQLQDEGGRTVLIRGLPYGVSPWTVKEAFSRCGPVHQVMIREPTFREAEDARLAPRTPGGRSKPKPHSKPKRAFAIKPHSDIAYSTPHGLVVFKDEEGFQRATTDSFRIFGVSIEGAAVTTMPAHMCRTLYVENFQMRKGGDMVDAINAVLQPHFTVGPKSLFLDNEMPQVVAITLRNYATVRAVDDLLTAAGFYTTFQYTVPKVRIFPREAHGHQSNNVDEARDWKPAAAAAAVGSGATSEDM